jgi:pimeloyl-ACP methyl ester carboxylesterase
MDPYPVPVILVHGWNSHPGIWNRLVPLLESASILSSRFDYAGMQDATLPQIALALEQHILSVMDASGYDGKIDIVCHSVGTCAARYLLEVLDGTTRRERVRQLIGIGPPNDGSALAELFHDPRHGPAIIRSLAGTFVPPGFDPSADRIVQDVRPESPFMKRLRSAGTRDDIRYRIIATANPGRLPDFFPWFEGKTWVRAEDGQYRLTFEGDGIVPNSESVLPGTVPEILPAGLSSSRFLPSPDQYCHISQPRNPVVIERVMQHLKGSKSKT